MFRDALSRGVIATVTLAAWVTAIVAPTGLLVRNAYAAEAPSVLLFGVRSYEPKPPQDGEIVEAIDTVLGDRVEESGAVRRVQAPAADDTAGAVGTEAERTKALELLNDGIKEAAASRPAAAIKRFAEGEELLKKAANRLKPDDFKTVRRAYFAWATAAAEEERGDDEVEALIRKALAISEKERPDLTADLLEKAKKIKGKGPHKVRFAVTGRGVNLTVNGRPANGGEFREPKAQPGLYFVVVEYQGRTWGRAVDVTGDVEWTAKAEELGGTSLEAAIAKGDLRLETRERLARLAQAAGADYVVTGLVLRVGNTDGVVTFIYERSSKLLVKQKPVRVAGVDEARGAKGRRVADAVLAALAAFPRDDEAARLPVAVYDPAATGTQAAEEAAPAAAAGTAAGAGAAEAGPAPDTSGYAALDSDRSIVINPSDEAKAQRAREESVEAILEETPPIYTRWWFWTIIGTVLVAGGITTAVLLQPDKPNNTPSLNLPPPLRNTGGQSAAAAR